MTDGVTKKDVDRGFVAQITITREFTRVHTTGNRGYETETYREDATAELFAITVRAEAIQALGEKLKAHIDLL